MPRRFTPLVNGCFYHVYNHGIDERDTFTSKREYDHFQLAMWFYQPAVVPYKLSQYLNLSTDIRLSVIQDFNQRPKAVKIHAYCLMSNHYHFLIEQVADRGISKYLGQLQNSYTKYFNIKHERKGPLFLAAFRAKLIRNEAQFLHVSRYIHLNPHTAQMIKNLDQLKHYPYSSCPEYFGQNLIHPITDTSNIGGYFKTQRLHWEFIANQADYQKQLAHIAHLLDNEV